VTTYQEPTWIPEVKAAYPEAFRELFRYGFDCGPGWRDLILWALAGMVAADPLVQIHQIKQKFGSLRINPQSDSDEVWRLSSEAEARSLHICELCGQPGAFREGRYVTRCDGCTGKPEAI
jgi:hypothetical protein